MSSKNNKIKTSLKSIIDFLIKDEEEAIKGYSEAYSEINKLDIEIKKKDDIIAEIEHILKEEEEHKSQLEGILEHHMNDSAILVRDINTLGEEFDERILDKIFTAMLEEKREIAHINNPKLTKDDLDQMRLSIDDITDDAIKEAIEANNLEGEITKFDENGRPKQLDIRFTKQDVLDFFTVGFAGRNTLRGSERNRLWEKFFKVKGARGEQNELYNPEHLENIKGTLAANKLENYLSDTTGYFNTFEEAQKWVKNVADPKIKTLLDELKNMDFIKKPTRNMLVTLLISFIKNYSGFEKTKDFPYEMFKDYAIKYLNKENKLDVFKEKNEYSGDRLTDAIAEYICNTNIINSKYDNISSNIIKLLLEEFIKSKNIDINSYTFEKYKPLYLESLKYITNKLDSNDKYKKSGDPDVFDLDFLFEQKNHHSSPIPEDIKKELDKLTYAINNKNNN